MSDGKESLKAITGFCLFTAIVIGAWELSKLYLLWMWG